MVIKEALALNVPIVTTDVGDVRKIIGDAVGCFICKATPRDVAEKINNVLNSIGEPMVEIEFWPLVWDYEKCQEKLSKSTKVCRKLTKES